MTKRKRVLSGGDVRRTEPLRANGSRISTQKYVKSGDPDIGEIHLPEDSEEEEEKQVFQFRSYHHKNPGIHIEPEISDVQTNDKIARSIELEIQKMSKSHNKLESPTMAMGKQKNQFS